MRVILLVLISSMLVLPSEAQFSKKVNKLKNEAEKALSDKELTTDDVAAGLKEALIKGVKNGTDQASALDGFYTNQDIKIPFPENAAKVAKAVKKIGMEKQVNEFVVTLNRSAEQAAKEAAPIFVDAIKGMSIDDAWDILKGDNKKAATAYLQEKTTSQLAEKMRPLIDEKLKSTNATKYYKDIIEAYNKLPLVTKQDSDLTSYATNKTIQGLFYLVGQEELKIRENPGERTSDLLKKVFKQQD